MLGATGGVVRLTQSHDNDRKKCDRGTSSLVVCIPLWWASYLRGRTPPLSPLSFKQSQFPFLHRHFPPITCPLRLATATLLVLGRHPPEAMDPPDPRPSSEVLEGLEQSPHDKRQCRFVKLENGFEALLIHDPEANMDGVALNIAVGSFSDDANSQGMAMAVLVRKSSNPHRLH